MLFIRNYKYCSVIANSNIMRNLQGENRLLNEDELQDLENIEIK